MADVHPFAAYLAEGRSAQRVATLPYDVMNRREAAAMAAGNPDSFLRVTRSEIELPDSVDPYDPRVYERARRNWAALGARALHHDPVPGYYVYSLVMDGRRQTGIVAAASVDDYDRGIVRRHERTRREKEDDRTRHITALRAQTGPVFLTYRDSDEIDAATAEAMAGDPVFDFVAEDGIRHSGWRVPAERTAALRRAFAAVPRLYIADGHHRAASASRVRAALAAEGDPGESDRFLSVIFPAGQLRILAYNRVLFDLNGDDEEGFLRKVRERCRVTGDAAPVPAAPGTVAMFLGGRWLGLELPAPASAGPVESLDVSLLQDRILQPLLGIDDPRTSPRIDFVGGIRGTAELERRVLSGECRVAFSLHPTTVGQLMAIADDQAIMPPKSTWFEPKLRDGLFVHAI